MMKLSNKALTLAELLLAVAILAFVLTGLLLVFINCFILNDASKNLSIATAHGQLAMEETKNTLFSNIANFQWDTAALAAKGLTTLNNEILSANVTGTNPKTITVTVNWMDRSVRSRNTTIETIITEP